MKNAKIYHNSLEEIERVLTKIKRVVTENDFVYFSFNGHGGDAGQMRLYAKCHRVGVKGNKSPRYESRVFTKKWLQNCFFDQLPCPVLVNMSTCRGASGLEFTHSQYPRIMVAASDQGVTNSWFDQRFRHYLRKPTLSILDMVDRLNTDRGTKTNTIVKMEKTVILSTGNEPTRGPNNKRGASVQGSSIIGMALPPRID